jgi:predicted small lipoprotein YifL
MKTVALLLGAICLLAGCGLKGPLYLPDQKPAAVPVPAPQGAIPAVTAPATPAPVKKPTDEDADQPPAPK